MKITRTIVIAMAFTIMLTTHGFVDKGGTPNADAGAVSAANLDIGAAIDDLGQRIIALEQSGDLKSAQAQSLLNKLEKAAKALDDINLGAAGDVSAKQSPQLNLQIVGKALKAVTDFLRELTKIVTDLPPDVVQPIID